MEEMDDFVRGVLVQQVISGGGMCISGDYTGYIWLCFGWLCQTSNSCLCIFRHQISLTKICQGATRGKRKEGFMITRCGSEEINAVDRSRTIREIVFTGCCGGLPL